MRSRPVFFLVSVVAVLIRGRSRGRVRSCPEPKRAPHRRTRGPRVRGVRARDGSYPRRRSLRVRSLAAVAEFDSVGRGAQRDENGRGQAQRDTGQPGLRVRIGYPTRVSPVGGGRSVLRPIQLRQDVAGADDLSPGDLSSHLGLTAGARGYFWSGPNEGDRWGGMVEARTGLSYRF